MQLSKGPRAILNFGHTLAHALEATVAETNDPDSDNLCS